MKITWLGQAGLLLETDNLRIMIDPYLSDSVKSIDPKNYRRVAVDENIFALKPDVLIFTHNHMDHYDPETVKSLLTEDSKILVLAPKSVWSDVKKFGGNNNYVQFNRYTRWTESGICFRAVTAEHSDEFAIGVILDDGKKKYYVTGDTLYNEKIFDDIPNNIYAVFLPINGVGNNMNMEDARKFCERVRPRYAVPVHCGMFDEIDMSSFNYKNKIIPEIYKEIKFK